MALRRDSPLLPDGAAPGTDQVGAVWASSAETGETAWVHEQRAATTMGQLEVLRPARASPDGQDVHPPRARRRDQRGRRAPLRVKVNVEVGQSAREDVAGGDAGDPRRRGAGGGRCSSGRGDVCDSRELRPGLRRGGGASRASEGPQPRLRLDAGPPAADSAVRYSSTRHRFRGRLPHVPRGRIAPACAAHHRLRFRPGLRRPPGAVCARTAGNRRTAASAPRSRRLRRPASSQDCPDCPRDGRPARGRRGPRSVRGDPGGVPRLRPKRCRVPPSRVAEPSAEAGGTRGTCRPGGIQWRA